MRDPVTSTEIGRLLRRADFLRAAQGRRRHLGAFTLQLGPHVEAERPEARIGLTLTRKVGCAVVRNRARRRLKAAIRLAPELPVVAGHDYVVIGRDQALRQPFASLQADLARAIREVHAAQAGGGSKPRRRSDETRPKRIAPEP